MYISDLPYNVDHGARHNDWEAMQIQKALG